ncbi:hypothetical protein [Pseudomonas sp. NPDC079086]|uniref:hypothetical protein n=1 Tax=unclassified Pseudomonas TaxID=196821 RepID=UPI0037C5E9ED
MSAADHQDEKDGLDVVLKISVAGILLSLLIAILFYRHAFPGPLSLSSNDWSALGSFFGGIFGPLVAFITLMALLKTIRIQRKLLATQQNEFKKLFNLQNETYETQCKQLKQAEEQASTSYISNYQSTSLRMLEQQISLNQSIIERCTKSSYDLIDRLALQKPGATQGQIDQLLVQKEQSEKTINELSQLAIKISLQEYKSINILKKDISEGLLKALEA